MYTKTLILHSFQNMYMKALILHSIQRHILVYEYVDFTFRRKVTIIYTSIYRITLA